MKDTSEEVEVRFREEILKRSPGERLSMACRMFDTARALIQAEEKTKQSSEMSKKDKEYLFIRLYHQDFTPAEIKKILRSLKAAE
jgi:hypothetical protein